MFPSVIGIVNVKICIYIVDKRLCESEDQLRYQVISRNHTKPMLIVKNKISNDRKEYKSLDVKTTTNTL